MQMRTHLIIGFLLIGSLNLSAQDGKAVRIMAGSRIIDVLKPEDVYFYPQFIAGRVYFKDGSASAANLNYNSLTDQMLFIGNNGDTLALTNETTVSLISVGEDTFYFDEGYLRQVKTQDEAVLAVREIWEIADTRKISSFNNSTSATGVTAYTTLLHRSGRRDDLVVNEELIIRKKPYHFYSLKNSKFKRADKRILQMFGYKSQ